MAASRFWKLIVVNPAKTVVKMENGVKLKYEVGCTRCEVKI